MSPNGEFLRNQPWRNDQSEEYPASDLGQLSYTPFAPMMPIYLPQPFVHDTVPFDADYPWPDSQVPTDFVLPQAQYGWQNGAYPIPSQSNPMHLHMQSFIPGPWDSHSLLLSTPYGLPPSYAYPTHTQNPNPVIGLNYLCNDPSNQYYQHQPLHQQHSPEPRSYRREVSHTQGHRSHHVRPSTPVRETTGASISIPPKKNQSRQEKNSPLYKFRQSAVKASQNLLGTARTSVRRHSAPVPKERRNRSKREKEEEEKGDDCLSGDDSWSQNSDNPGFAKVRVSGGWSPRFLRQYVTPRVKRRAESPSPTGSKNKTSVGTWQREYRRVSGNQDERSSSPSSPPPPPPPRPYSYPGQSTQEFLAGRVTKEREEDLESDMSDLEGNKQISQMNGLLDIWDANNTPGWEAKTFALCDLSHCDKCGRFYAPMRTTQHACGAKR